MKRYAFVPLALTSIFSMSGCDLSEPSTKEAQTRSFAPRMYNLPPSDLVRLEVSTSDLSKFEGNSTPQSGYYQSFQVSYSARQISADRIPTGTLYFRISGLDASGTPIWVFAENIPDGPAPAVDIGTTKENTPRSIDAPRITTPSGASYPMVSCTTGTPGWTTDGTNPSSTNMQSTRFTTGSPLQATIQLSQGQTLTARCTDKIVWSPASTYKFTGPTSNPNPTGPADYFGNKVPTLDIPTGPSGQIKLSVNATDTSGIANYSNWKIAYKMGQSNWSAIQPGTTISYTGTGNISAYLMAWDGNNWVSGHETNSVYPKNAGIQPGGALPLPSVYVYTPVSGTGSSDISINAFASGYSYTGWKAFYRISSGDTNWIPLEFPVTQSAASTSLYAAVNGVTGSGTFSTYLVAYNPTSQVWMSSAIVTAIYPMASAIGPGKAFPAPQLVPPSNGTSSVTYVFDTTAYPTYSRWNLATKINADQPSIQNLSTASTYLSGTGTMTAYLVAWNGTTWVSGEAVSKSYPPQPDSAAANGPGTELSQVVINAPESVTGMVRFSDPGTVTCPSCMNWKVAYKTSKSPDWKILDLTSGFTVRDTGSIEAYLMAWSTNNYRWLYGPVASANYPNLPTPPVILPPNGSTMSLNINLPLSLPDKITFSKGAQMSYSHWMVTYKIIDLTDWKLMSIDSFYTMESNATISYYPMAWDATSKRWITGTSSSAFVSGGQSITNPEVVAPGGPLPAPTIVIKPPSGAEAGFNLNLTAADSAAYTAGTWKIVYQFDASAKYFVEANSTIGLSTPGATSLTVYTEAWNPTTKRWTSGKTASISLPVVVTVDAPVFKNTNGDLLGAKWEREGFTALPLRIEAGGTIYYTTATYGDPDPANLSNGTSIWTSASRLPYLGEEPLMIKAISVVDGFRSAISSIEVSRPGWTSRDNEAAGCLGSNGTVVVACGDGAGPWIWSQDQGWSTLDDNWSHSDARFVKVTKSEVLVITNTEEILRLDAGMGMTSFESIAPGNLASFGGVEVFNDTIWTTTTDGLYYYDEVNKDWYQPTVASGTSLIFTGTPGAMWSDSTSSLWFAIGYNLYRYGPSLGSGVNAGITIWYNQLSNGACKWIGRDPLVSGGVAFGSSSAVYQLPASPWTGGTIPSINSFGGIVMQVASSGSAAFVATDNGIGGGSVARSNSWNYATNITTLRRWPTSGNTTISSQGLVRYKANGSDWLLATSLQGTYQFKILP